MKMHELLELLNNLKRMPRTGWLLCNIPLSEVEDVAQHIFDVAAITLLLADELERSGTKLDRERALGMAIVHDWAEAIVGDFPNTALEHLESASVKTRMEQSALAELLHMTPNKERYRALWQEYCEKRTVEAKLVHAADYLSMLVQALKYHERGNRSRELGKLWLAVKRDLGPYTKEFKPVKELTRELDKRFKD